MIYCKMRNCQSWITHPLVTVLYFWLTTAVAGNITCNGVSSGSICYWMTGTKEHSAFKANDLCVQHQGTLASIPDQATLDFLITDYGTTLGTTDQVFIGINDLRNESTYTEWNGGAVSWTNWKSTNHNAGTKQNCGRMDMSLTAKVENYKWHLKECTSTDKSYYGLCSRNDNEPNTCKGALISGDICYWLTVNIGDTDALNQECVQDGGMLASIPSQKILDDLDIFYSFALSKVDPDTWTTWDNVPITWTYWQGGITLTDSSKACARLLPNSEPKYNWENHVCGETSYYGLCSTHITFNLPSSSPPVHINVTTESVTESIDGTTHYTRTTETVISETSISETTTETVTSKTPPFNQESETTTSEKTSSETTPFNIASETTPSGTMSSETTPSEITSSKTTSSSVSISNTTYICRCGTKLLNIGDDLLAQTLRELIANLTVDKHLLSSFIRKKTSADDERPSVKVVATLGIALYVIEICFIVALDGPWYYSVGKKIMKYFKKKLTKCND